MAALLRLASEKYWYMPKYPDQNFKDQTIIVTGANVGLGFEGAKHFVRLGAAKVILAVRSVSKGEEARKAIEASTGRAGVAAVWELDLGSYQSVKKFAERVNGLDRLDAVVENAGIAVLEFSTFEDNESTITVNVVSTFLLALLLFPKLRESSKATGVPSRLSIVSSAVHGWTNFEEHKADNIFDTINNKETAKMRER
jgi:retinol dehydrogenase-12